MHAHLSITAAALAAYPLASLLKVAIDDKHRWWRLIIIMIVAAAAWWLVAGGGAHALNVLIAGH